MHIVIAAMGLIAIGTSAAAAEKPEFTPAQNRFMEFARVAAEAGSQFGENRLIDRIELIGKDTFRIGAGACTLIATLDELKPESEGFVSRFVTKATGVRNFVVKAGPVTCSGNP
jgi:hypothetical protein